jgi:alkylhydroperoxidase family enzyme
LTPLDELRSIVEHTPAAPPVMDAYLEKVRLHAYRITDADVETLRAGGLSEDEIFEHTVAVAIGAGLERLDAAERVIG